MGCHYTTTEYRWTLGGPSKTAIKSCFDKDVQYIGNPLNKKDSNNNFGNTQDALACQNKCQTTPGCGWFDRDKEGDCWLKTRRGYKAPAPGGVSGPKSCEEGMS